MLDSDNSKFVSPYGTERTKMKFHIEKLGKIDKAEIDVKDLTVICGPNSSNKTWIAYSIFHNLYYKHEEHPSIFARMDIEDMISGKHPVYQLDAAHPKFRTLFDRVFNTYLRFSNVELAETFNTYREVFSETSIETDDDNKFGQTIYESILTSAFDGELENTWEDVYIKSSENSPIYELNFTDEEDGSDLELINDAICELICLFIWSYAPITRPFVITSERVGSLVFQKDIDGATIKITDDLNSLLEKNRDNKEIRKIVRRLHLSTLGSRANLSVPVRKNLEAVRNAATELKKTSFIKDEHPYISDALQRIVKGRFEIENNILIFKSEEGKYELPITVASSSIKSLFIIDLYINSLAKENDLLIIDEPELNLHPDNQRLMAQVIARMVNAGIKVIITTHSDYLIRELNNLIMLSSDFSGKSDIMESANLITQDILSPSQVSAYSVSSDGGVSPMDVSEEGIDARIFDDLILNANSLQDEIFFAREEE